MAAAGSRVGRGVIYRTMRLGGSGATIQRNAAMTRQQLLTQAPDLHVRDLRALSPDALVGRGSQLRDTPAFLVREDSIVLRMLHVKALIRADALLLFDTDRRVVQRCVADVHRLLEDAGGEEAAEIPSFELRALEALLEHVCTSFDHQTKKLFPVVEAVCRSIQLDPVGHSMSQFLPVLSRLRRLEAQLNGVEEVLEDLISNPADLKSIAALRHTHASAGRGDDEGAQEEKRQRTVAPTQVAVQEVEFLLESYSHLIDEVQSELQHHIANVENLKDVMQMQIDHNRNRIISMNLKISIGSLGAGVGGALGGLWGMNLQSGYEDHACWQLQPPELLAQWHLWTTALELPCFATTVGGIGAASGGVLLVCLRTWRKLPLRAAARIEDLHLLDHVLREVDSELDEDETEVPAQNGELAKERGAMLSIADAPVRSRTLKRQEVEMAVAAVLDRRGVVHGHEARVGAPAVPRVR